MKKYELRFSAGDDSYNISTEKEECPNVEQLMVMFKALLLLAEYDEEDVREWLG